jgi:LAS superfamily LD-carboxypeptidase LdcB
MADKPTPIGTRLTLVDPNNFDGQYSGGVFGDNRYNMSVPMEDLSITVELKTSSKARTVLTTQNDISLSISEANGNKSSSIVKVNFIDGTSDKTTGNQDYLTTKYTELSTELTDIEETLGITSIDIDFNSSYAPQVNISFIDVRGGSIFQNGGKSKFGVFFKLPYPIFELTIKGYYGKPVKYCLHMTKMNTRFNSQTGNFELNANFVGYTYAMLADMIIGYLKAAAETPRGKQLLAAKGVPSINEFLQKIANIDSLVKSQLLNNNDEDTNNLAIINDLRQNLESMRLEITSTAELKFKYDKYEVPAPLNESIVIIRDPNQDGTVLNQQFPDADNNAVVNTFTKNFADLVTTYNTKAGSITELLITQTNFSPQSIIVTPSSLKSNRPFVYDKITSEYGITQSDTGAAEVIIKRLKLAANNIANDNNGWIRFYDFTTLLALVDDKLVGLSNKQDELTKFVALKLKDLITRQLGFDTSIRSIFKLFTTHVEIFLQQIFEVSAKYKDNELRTNELKKFVKSKNTDIASNSDVIYPWPEYNENNKEKYLGAKGVLTAPQNVPEIQFVEELYQGMLVSGLVQQKIDQIINNNVPTWYAMTPHDSSFFTDNVTPYDRLPASATHDDIARLVSLRATGFMGFANSGLTSEEIKSFAAEEANLLLKKYKSADNKLINLLNANYDTPDKFAAVTGRINGKNAPMFKNSGDKWEYVYIYDYYGRKILPIQSGFTNQTYVPILNVNNEVENAGYHIANVNSKLVFKTSEKNDDASYLTVIEKNDYDMKANASPSGNQAAIQFNGLRTSVTGPADIQGMGLGTSTGSFGVQEFKRIHYDGSNSDSPFYTVFYDDGNRLATKNYSALNFLGTLKIGSIDILNELTIKTLLFPGLTKTRKVTAGVDGKPYSTVYDIGTTITLPYSVGGGKLEPNDACDDASFGRIGSTWRNRELMGRNVGLIADAANNNNSNLLAYPWVNFGVYAITDYLPGVDGPPLQGQVSLFGSRFYHAQPTVKAKALLFLHCMPWKGLTSMEPFTNTIKSLARNVQNFDSNLGLLKQPEFLNTFQLRAGFVQVPKMLPAFIGGLLWRYREGLAGNPDPILFRSKFNNDYLIPTFEEYFGDALPATDEYMIQQLDNESMSAPMSFNARGSVLNQRYTKLETALVTLPEGVQQKFLAEFDAFVKSFDNDRVNFEIIPTAGSFVEGNDAGWVAAWDGMNAAVTVNGTTATVPLATVHQFFRPRNATNSFEKTFNSFTFVPEGDRYDDLFRYNFFVEFKDDNDTAPAILLKNMVVDYKYLANDSIFMWSEGLNDAPTIYQPVTISKTDFSTYMNTITEAVKTIVGTNEQKKFNNNELEEVKLEIYRTIKKIYDKWIGDSENGDAVIFQCCKTNADRLPTDKAMNNLNKLKAGLGDSLDLIDSFRFVTRSFKDIGDDFQINPIIISKLLQEDTNISFYDLISRILTDNNFDFVALPSFINYNDPNELKAMFTPFPYYESANIAASGPSFVCVYIGQTSTKLDFGKDSQYPNDGFDLRGDPAIHPPDFGTPKQPYEDMNAAFVVRYGQQNQNMFKDIMLDQSEFSETAESLQITDNIANRLSNTNQSYIGQNLYNVYSARSYKTEVDMLGNAMIQPMMYFQLENIPMFHGAYMITKVRHKIVPNHMTTTFTGTRIKAIETPILDAAALYSALLDSFELPKTAAGTVLTATVTGVAPIIRTLINNGASNANVDRQGNITLADIVFPTGIKNNIDDTPKLLAEAIQPLKAMLTEFVSYMKANGFVGNGGNYAFINSAFRTIPQQQAIRDKHPNTSAPVGTSNHGWGIAIDFQFMTKAGNIIPNYVDNKSNIIQGYNFDPTNPASNQALIWLLDNSYRFGFIIPAKLRDGVGLEEFWHFEYHGKSAACILAKSPNIHGHVVTTDKPYDASVTNPKEQNGTLAVYSGKDCDYAAVKNGDGSNVLSTKITKQDRQDNQIIVKNFLKNYFVNTLNFGVDLAKMLTAGIMGNIQVESGFNPTIKHLDTNGKYSYGLIQWNKGAYPDMFKALGTTALSEVTKLTDGYTQHFAAFVRAAQNTPGLNAYTAAFLFAKMVEICTFCYKTIEIYNADKVYNQSNRSKYAEDFLLRFNATGDALAW